MGSYFAKYLIHIRLESTRHKMMALARLHILIESSLFANIVNRFTALPVVGGLSCVTMQMCARQFL